MVREEQGTMTTARSRVGLGCMRLVVDETRDQASSLGSSSSRHETAAATIDVAIDEGARWLDTARAYGSNEQLVASVALRRTDVPDLKVITKCGMARPEGRWEPDGRASSILHDARRSLKELGDRPPDLLLLHVPDPKVAFETSLRALARARDDGLTRAIGLSNVTRRQLDAAEAVLGEGAIEGVEVALGAYDDAAARGGVLAWCKDRGVPLFAYSVLGGVAKAKERLARDTALRLVAKRHDVGPAEIMIAYLLAVDPVIVPIVGARTPETARRSIGVARLVKLEDEDLTALDARFPGLAMSRRPVRSPSPETATADVVILMGVTGSGKSRLAEEWTSRGYERLNRDTLGGTLAQTARRLGELLDKGVTRVVLDNTYVTRASRSEVIRVAHARGALVRCIHVDTPPHEAQWNITWRMLEKHGELLGGAELIKRARVDANLVGPNVLSQMERKIERPTEDEGFASIETLRFTRVFEGEKAGVALPLELVLRESQGVVSLREDALATLEQIPPDVPTLLFGWKPGATDAWRLRAEEALRAIKLPGIETGRRETIELSICSHAAGAPTCWCRPPLPGLWLAFQRRHRIDPRLSLFLTVTPTHKTMAKNLGIKAIP